ncbi:MAG: IPT/TIG domain-containing protein, partial [Candidatus Geothermincolia bacterium]
DYWNNYTDTPYTIEDVTYANGDHPRPNSYQGFRGYRSSTDSGVIDSGDHYAGWMDVSDSQKGITTGVQDFWQSFPKGFAADASGRTGVGLWPTDSNYHDGYNLRVGDEKSHNLFFYFHTGTGPQAGAAELAQVLNDPLWALAPSSWIASSGAVSEFTPSTETLEGRLGQYHPGGLDDYQAYDYYNDRTLSEDASAPWESWHPCMSLVQGGEHPASLDYFNMYGSAFYGNQPLEEESYGDGKCAFFDTKYDFDFGCWLQFLRTGDWRWKELAEPMSRHAEQLMMHDTELENGWDPAEYKDCVYGHCMHAERGCENGVRNYNSSTPQFAWGARGSELYYYLTGYPPSYRFASKLAEYMYNIWQFRTMTPGFYEGGDYGECGGVREPASTLNVLVEGWKLTGDARYRQLAQQVMDVYAPEDQFYIDGPVAGSGDRNIPVGFFSHYLCAMGRYAQVAGEFGLAGEAQTAKDRLVRFVDFMVDHTTFTFDGSFTSHYRWLIDGSDSEDQGEVNNWSLVCSDACAYAYAFTGDSAYLAHAADYFKTGVNVPYCNDMKGKLFYTSTKEATNHAVHGSIYMHYAKLAEGYPTVSSIAPSSGTVGTGVSVTDLAGSNFGAGAQVKITRSGSQDIAATDVSVVSPERITCKLDLTGAAEGVWNVVVTSQEGKSGTLTGGFTVVPKEPPPDPDPDPDPDPEPEPEPEPVPQPSLNATWYLAEGSTDWGFETHVAIENPNPEPVTARVTYMTGSGPTSRADVKLPALSQTVINPADDVGATDVSTKVQCLEGKSIAVDRRMTWTGKDARASEGHASMGVTAPARSWYLAEGSSNWGFETWLLIQNPGAKDAVCSVTYMVEGSEPRTLEKRVAANSRATFAMESDVGVCDASIMVGSDQPVIAERAMYRSGRREGHDSIGVTAPARDSYLAEGTTGWGFTTYVLVQNPNAGEATVSLTCMTPDGARELEPFVMPSRSRRTVRVNDLLPGEDCSVKVHASVPVVAERAMYWNSNAGEACHDSAGISGPHAVFYLPDGETADGHETWVLVQNPNSSAVSIEVSYLTTTGKGNVTFKDTVPACSRKTYSMGDRLPDSRASAVVRCVSPGKKIIVERAMYWNGRAAGTSVMGAFED